MSLHRPCPAARQPAGPPRDLWLRRAAECERVRADALAGGDVRLAVAMVVLAAQYRRVVALLRGAH
jgi:hypothetical protein